MASWPGAMALFASACASPDRMPPLAGAGDPVRGRDVFIAREGGHCVLCHTAPGIATAGNIGPPMDGIGSRLDAAALRARIADITRLYPGSVMPTFHRVEGMTRVASAFAGKPVLTGSPNRCSPSPRSWPRNRTAPIAVSIDGPAAPVFERGRRLYLERQGQLNVACTHCHDAHWGRTLLNELLSRGHPADWPAYRLEWQSLGSLQRRLRACYFGVRAEQPAFGSPDLLALELYLAARARGLALSVPGVRR